jgi:hypothetical protein
MPGCQPANVKGFQIVQTVSVAPNFQDKFRKSFKIMQRINGFGKWNCCSGARFTEIEKIDGDSVKCWSDGVVGRKHGALGLACKWNAGAVGFPLTPGLIPVSGMYLEPISQAGGANF